MTKILVIEDVEALRNDVVEMLSFEGFDVLSAENGSVGLQTALSELPDVIVCDIMMPDLNGYDVLERIRADSRTATTPFIFMTARTERDDMRYGMVQGADDYITKPFRSVDLLKSIQTQLNKKQAHNQVIEERIQKFRESITTALPHELRTPLVTIMGYADFLMLYANNITPSEIIDYAHNITKAAQRLHHLIENYLSYARSQVLKTAKQKIRSQEFDTTSHPASMIEFQAQHKAQQYRREADLILHLQANNPIQISESDFNKVIEEAIDNAFKFSQKGTPVTITTTYEAPYLIISIQDRGYGMTPEQINAIGAYLQFDRWLHEQQGNGLGLVIIREFVTLYNGVLEIDSSISQGTNLRIKLLVAKENFI